MQDLLKALILLKQNPELTTALPQSELLKMMEVLFKAFTDLKTAIETNKIKGEDGKTPVAGVDYASKQQTEAMVNTELNRFFRQADTLQRSIERKVSRLKNGRDGKDGKDATITPQDIEKAARLASQMVEMPDFASLITQEPQAIRDALELLQGEERLDASAIKGLEKYMGKQGGGLGGGTGVRRLSLLDDVTIVNARTNSTLQYNGTRWAVGVNITVSHDEPQNPQYGDLWLRLPT